MDGPAFVRPAGNGPKGETGTTVKNQKTGGFLRPEGALIPPPQDAAQHRMGVEVHLQIRGKTVFPRWMAFTNVLVIFALLKGISLLMPVSAFRLGFTNGLMSESMVIWFGIILFSGADINKVHR